jgi:transposase
LRIKTLLNRIEKFKSFVYTRVVLDTTAGEERLIVHVEARKNGAPLCSGCGEPRPCYDRRSTPRLFEFVPLWGIPVFFSYHMRRVNCGACGAITTEAVPWARGQSALTRSYSIFLARWARRLSWSETALIFKTSWESVYRCVQWMVDWGLEHRDLGGITAIGVDEVNVGKGQFITILYQIDEGMRRILGIAKGKSRESLCGLIEELGEHVASIRFVCSDMARPYLSAIADMLGESVHILDRFHIVQNLNKAIDEVRNQEAKELARKGANPLKGTKYCFLKKRRNLTRNQKLRLKDLVALGLKTVRAYQLKEMFQAFWSYESPAWARKFLRAWCTRALRSGLVPIKRFARTLRQHEDLLLNWFEAEKQFSSGVVEGLNRKMNLITRKSYGFRTEEVRNVALFHTLGCLPEPEVTHQFC